MRWAPVLTLVLVAGCGGGGGSTGSTEDEPDRTCALLPPEALAGEVDVRMELVEASATSCSYAALDPTSAATVTVWAVAEQDVDRSVCRGGGVVVDVEGEVGDTAYACATAGGGRGVVRAGDAAVVVEVGGIDPGSFARVLAGALLPRVVVPASVPAPRVAP